MLFLWSSGQDSIYIIGEVFGIYNVFLNHMVKRSIF